MKNDIKRWFYIGTLFIILFGSLLHFVYEWSGKNTLVGIFGAVNESTWEHLKLLFWPAFIFSLLEYRIIGNKFINYITAKATSFYLGIWLIIILFYTYTGIIGEHFLIIDIAIFIISAIVSQYIGYIITSSEKNISNKINILSLIAIMVLVFVFVIFTIDPPKIPLFEDPLTGGYGL